MNLTDRALAAFQRTMPIEEADAHCDIPCGIYDPHGAAHPESGKARRQRVQGASGRVPQLTLTLRSCERGACDARQEGNSDYLDGLFPPRASREVSRSSRPCLEDHEARFEGEAR